MLGSTLDNYLGHALAQAIEDLFVNDESKSIHKAIAAEVRAAVDRVLVTELRNSLDIAMQQSVRSVVNECFGIQSSIKSRESISKSKPTRPSKPLVVEEEVSSLRLRSPIAPRVQLATEDTQPLEEIVVSVVTTFQSSMRF
jgi:hypothetical protein